jgi:hypothetical protein
MNAARLHILFIIGVIACGLIGTGCENDSESMSTPEALLGNWSEDGCATSRILVLEEDGTFSHYEAGQPAGNGTFTVSGSTITLDLMSGHFKWAESTNTAPSTSSFTYTSDGSGMSLTSDLDTTDYARPT